MCWILYLVSNKTLSSTNKTKKLAPSGLCGDIAQTERKFPSGFSGKEFGSFEWQVLRKSKSVEIYKCLSEHLRLLGDCFEL